MLDPHNPDAINDGRCAGIVNLEDVSGGSSHAPTRCVGIVQHHRIGNTQGARCAQWPDERVGRRPANGDRFGAVW